MKAIVYSTQFFEKELLAKANHKKHDITLISNPLNSDTVYFAEGKDAVIVTSTDNLTTEVIKKLSFLGIKFISNRTSNTQHINTEVAGYEGIKIAKVDAHDFEDMAKQTIKNLDNWQNNKCVGSNCACALSCKIK